MAPYMPDTHLNRVVKPTMYWLGDKHHTMSWTGRVNRGLGRQGISGAGQKGISEPEQACHMQASRGRAVAKEYTKIIVCNKMNINWIHSTSISRQKK